jgi:AraC-like DNA-binding protein
VYFFKFSFLPAPPFFQHMIFYFTAFTLYLGTALVLVTRYFNIRDDMDRVKTALDAYLDEYSRLNMEFHEVKSSSRQNYTMNIDKAEEKIQRAMEYILENYREDLSREGLAALVNVHPDNLGRMFKIVTGRKMGDYINELRIRDAARQIIESDENIIHIAFATGFDSLRTFNRVFRKVMGMTPETYRKMPKVAQHPYITTQK